MGLSNELWNTDFSEIPLDTDVESACALLSREPAQKFALPANRFLVVKREDKASRRGIRRLIFPENADVVIAALPEPGERTHCLLRGDFVLCDLIPRIVAVRGRVSHLRIATLGMSVANAETLAGLLRDGSVEKLTLVVSHYFAQVDKATTFATVHRILSGISNLKVVRNHAKVICLPSEDGTFAIEGSANLRSSDNVEQMCITNDGETHDFHASWIEELAK